MRRKTKKTGFMNIVLLQSPLSSEEIELLMQEFPHYLFLAFTETTYRNLSKEDWGKVEIIYGNRLAENEFALADQLKWIHSPSDQLNRLCLDLIADQGNVQITVTREENVVQIGEYVLGVMLAFAKNLFKWKFLDQDPAAVWASELRDQMWTLNGKKMLQIGLGKTGSEVARMAKQFGMTIWGVQPHASFNPYCHKTFSLENFHHLISEVDIVSLCLPRSRTFEEWFGVKEFDLMKNDSILSVVGSYKIFSQAAISKMQQSTKLRGLLIDSSYQNPIPQGSLLWQIPQAIITPEVGSRPKSESTEAYRTFRYNLRQYVHGNASAMRNRIDHNAMIFDI